MSRQLDNLRPWAAWMVRHRMAWVLMLFNLLLHVPVEIVHSAISSIPDSVRAVRDANRDIRQAAWEAWAERAPVGPLQFLRWIGPNIMLLLFVLALAIWWVL